MPKQSSYDPANAFKANRKFKSANTRVTVMDGYVRMYLFDNLIAKKEIKTGRIEITNAGWPTNTTRDRLNALGASISISGGKRGDHLSGTMYLNGEEMKDDKWYTLKGEKQAEDKNPFGALAAVMMMGEIFGRSKEESNAWKLRMLKAGVPEGALHLPEDWDSLPEEEKENRLNKVIDEFKK